MHLNTLLCFEMTGHAFKRHPVEQIEARPRTSELKDHSNVSLTSPESLFSEFFPMAARSIFAMFLRSSQDKVKVCGLCITR